MRLFASLAASASIRASCTSRKRRAFWIAAPTLAAIVARSWTSALVVPGGVHRRLHAEHADRRLPGVDRDAEVRARRSAYPARADLGEVRGAVDEKRLPRTENARCRPVAERYLLLIDLASRPRGSTGTRSRPTRLRRTRCTRCRLRTSRRSGHRRARRAHPDRAAMRAPGRCGSRSRARARAGASPRAGVCARALFRCADR